MATIRSKEIRLFNGERWIQRLQFSLKDQMFHIPMPESYNAAFGSPVGESRKKLDVKGKTVAEADKAFDAAIEKWKGVDTKERKVIAYCLYMNTVNKIKRKDRFWGGMTLLPERQDIDMFHSPDVGIAFSYEVCTEATTGGKQYYYNRVPNPDYDPKSDSPKHQIEWNKEEAVLGKQAEHPSQWEDHKANVIIVDWTQEREDFFKQLRDRLQVLARQAIEFEKMILNQKGLDNTMAQMLSGTYRLALPPAETEKDNEPGATKADRRKK